MNVSKAIAGGLVLVCSAGFQSTAMADEGSGLLGDIDFSWSGYVRSETAFGNAGDKRNPFNQNGNLYNGVAVQRTSALGTDTTVRSGGTDHQPINLQLFRVQLDTDTKLLPQLRLIAKLRGVFDPAWYTQFDPNEVGGQAAGKLYGRPNYFQFNVERNSDPMPLEWTGRHYQVYFPALFLQYDHGPFNIRVGNQQIAWGQALFFRVLDVVDGLDLRRHSVLDYVPEEFSDKRVPSLAVRASYQITDGWLADAFVQKFQPTVYSNPNTPYNVIASQFTVHDLYSNTDTRVNYGIRFKGSVGDVGMQAIYSRRYNPDGVFRWTKSGVNRDIPGLAGSGTLLKDTAFEVDSTGVWSADEWFQYAGMARLNGVTGLNASINDFPAAGLLGAVPVATKAQAAGELNQFFQLAGGFLVGQHNGGLRGHIAREYKAEHNIGGGLSYVVNSTPDSLLDQLIINVEATYVPNRTFTDPSLTVDFLRKHEWTADFVLEKYQRFSKELPATYFVFQGIYKSESDLFGRYLGGMGGDQNTVAPGYGGGFKALAFAFQQPFPQLIWRADFAILYDLKGGMLMQPAVRWKPNGHFTAEAFYNFLNGHLGNPNKNIIGTVDFADELGLRLGYQF